MSTKVREHGEIVDLIDIYVYGKKISPKYATAINKIQTLDDIAILTLDELESFSFMVVNTKGDVLYSTDDDELDDVLCVDKSSECYGIKTNSNKITYYLEELGQDGTLVCDKYYNNEVLIQYEMTYKDGVLSTPKKISSITGKEYVQKHNIKCNNN